MRELEKHSITDNIEFLKENDKPLYKCVTSLAVKFYERYEQDKDMLDNDSRFESYLSSFKNSVGNILYGLFFLKHPGSSPTLKKKEDIVQILKIFEQMFFDIMDQNEFNELDPELQDLYLEAQKEIEKELNDESGT